MNTTSSGPAIEPWWRTHLQAAVFAAPAAVAWTIACNYIVPKLKEVCHTARLDPEQLGELRWMPWFLVQGDVWIWLFPVLILAALELFRRGYPPYRRLTVGAFVWLVNMLVLLGLMLLLIMAVVAAVSLQSAS